MAPTPTRVVQVATGNAGRLTLRQLIADERFDLVGVSTSTADRVGVDAGALAGLDVTTALVVKQLMHEFAARGGAVLHCSHMLDVVENTAHRIAVLDRGKLLADGTAADLRQQAGAGADTHLDQVFRALVQASDPAAAARAILG